MKLCETTRLQDQLTDAYDSGRRLLAPFMGLPGLRMSGSTIKQGLHDPEIHTCALLRLARQFQPDFLFTLMDLSLEAGALGATVKFPDSGSPGVVETEYDRTAIERWRQVDIASDPRLMATLQTVENLQVPLPPATKPASSITGPFTLATLLMGGKRAADAISHDRQELTRLVDFCLEVCLSYSSLLRERGAELICVLEPTVSLLGPGDAAYFSIPLVAQIVSECERAGVDTLLHVCGNTMPLVDTLMQADATGLSLDSAFSGVDLPALAERLPPDSILFGNINPTGALLRGTTEEVICEVKDLLKAMAPYPGFLLSSGCDLPYSVPEENLAAFFNAGRHRWTGGAQTL